MTTATPKPRAGEHTKGPWRFVQEDNAIVGADGFLISDCIPRSADFGMKERDANARRIVVCVNACEGMSTESLEEGTQPRLENATMRGDLLASENKTLRERELELVELLKAHFAHTTQSIKDIGGCDHSVGICCCDMIRDCDAASALLAKVSP